MQRLDSPGRRRALHALGAGTALGLAGRAAWAQDFPARPVTLLCPFGAGGSVDQYMRVLSVTAAPYLGQAVIIENKPGAGGNLSASLAARARPDGYTLAMSTGSTFRAPWLEPKIGFSPLKDFTYVIGMTSLEFCAVVRADSPLKSFADFMQAGKTRPGEIQYAAGDPTTLVPVTMVPFQEKYGVRFQHIPFKSGADMATSLMGGYVDVVMDSVGTYVPYIQSGKLRLLGALGASRLPAWPKVPTATEQGYDLVLSAPMGLLGPQGIAPDVVQKLHHAFHRAMGEPAIERVLATLNQPQWYRNPEEFAAYARRTYDESGDLLRRARLI
ncbi:tripartite tricarboxylate transporter substrate binding protein [Bordetella sp. BOR01]|uniref:Bug family tripartite tricarboxylate transporter substrate binding protein n=1 Tax=Bordetella sp. BOR01 TaxID=2854779 RepID=UPI001C44CE21|nr:tripartite tricarboxylate transporter substrate binding protein [Bordetella sp. BOR01]MBV7486874.1 tripartite tricarboxylate transporter substrate binding protein [Bordetella sp. BOR01]